jgi:hypothetical protein
MYCVGGRYQDLNHLDADSGRILLTDVSDRPWAVYPISDGQRHGAGPVPAYADTDSGPVVTI